MKITISGMPGSGKSTVAKMLASRLSYSHFSAGDFMRDMAKDHGVGIDDLSSMAEEDGGVIDKEIDARSSALGKEKDNFVMDTRLGFHFIPDSFKVRLIVEPKIGATRIIGAARSEEGFSNVDEAVSEIAKRVASERERYQKYYNIDKDDEHHFDLIVDTSNLSPEEVVSKIEDSIRNL